MRNLIVSPVLSLCRCLNLGEMLCTDNRILEETSCATHHRRFRQLLLTDPDYHLSDQCRSQICQLSCIDRNRGRPWPREREGPIAVRWEGFSFCDAASRQCIGNCIPKMSVIKSWTRLATQGKHHMGNDVSSLDLRILENRITISIFAILNRNADKLFLYSIITVNRMDHILDFDSVCPDVLNCSSADFTRNIRQILYAPKSFLRCPVTEIIEGYSGAYRD